MFLPSTFSGTHVRTVCTGSYVYAIVDEFNSLTSDTLISQRTTEAGGIIMVFSMPFICILFTTYYNLS